MPDPAFFEKRKRSVREQLAGTMFDAVPEPAAPPPVPARAEPPSVASGSSEIGADQARRLQEAQCVAILLALLRAGATPNSGRYLSRDDLHRLTDIRETDLCARLGPSGPLLATESRGGVVLGKKRAGISAVGNAVLGYQLTHAGYDRVRRSA